MRGQRVEHIPRFLWHLEHHQFQLHPGKGEAVRQGQTHSQEPESETLQGTGGKASGQRRNQATRVDMQRRKARRRAVRQRDSDILTGEPRGPGEPLGPISPRGPYEEVGVLFQHHSLRPHESWLLSPAPVKRFRGP